MQVASRGCRSYPNDLGGAISSERSGEEHLCPTQHVSEHQHMCMLCHVHASCMAPTSLSQHLQVNVQVCHKACNGVLRRVVAHLVLEIRLAEQYCGLRLGCEIDGPFRSGPLYTGYHVSYQNTSHVRRTAEQSHSNHESAFVIEPTLNVETWRLPWAIKP